VGVQSKTWTSVQSPPYEYQEVISVQIFFLFLLSGLVAASQVTTVNLGMAQFIACQKPFVGFGNVPIPDSQTIEMPARDRPLNPPCDARRIPGGVP
jgi:hypothetical protein